MAIIDFSGIRISYPTPLDGANIPEPIISKATSDHHGVMLTLTCDSEMFSLNAVIQRYADSAHKRITLTDNQARFLDKETRQREVVGIMQWRYAHTLLHWVEAGELDPFGEITTDKQRKSA